MDFLYEYGMSILTNCEHHKRGKPLASAATPKGSPEVTRSLRLFLAPVASSPWPNSESEKVRGARHRLG